ncbi:MAG: two-component system response regulator [Balneolaceae bacterium]
MKYTILVIDDDKPIHLFTDKIFGEDYELIHAQDAQEAINVLSREPVNIILSDIHMPGISGLEFIESLKSDALKKNIPILIMTSLPGVEKEKKALELGAADFIDKSLFFKESKQDILNRIQMKLVTNENLPDIPEEIAVEKKDLVSALMDEVLTGDFFTASRKLCTELRKYFSFDHIYLWSVRGGEPQVLLSIGTDSLHSFGPDDLKKEETFQEFLIDKQPYLSNYVYGENKGIFAEASKKADLPAEAGIPLYAINDRELVKNKMKIPSDTDLFGYMVLKRNKLISTTEFKFISRFVIQSGTILWRLFSKL